MHKSLLYSDLNYKSYQNKTSIKATFLGINDAMHPRNCWDGEGGESMPPPPPQAAKPAATMPTSARLVCPFFLAQLGNVKQHVSKVTLSQTLEFDLDSPHNHTC